MSKEFANKGVKRNKTPLQNIVIEIRIVEIKEDTYLNIIEALEKYKYNEKDYNGVSCRFCRGYITPEELKEKLGVKQWMKFCNGKRKFIIQRRINHNNI